MGVILAQNNNGEEEMYKEMFEALLAGKHDGIDIVDDVSTTINSDVFVGVHNIASIHMANAEDCALAGAGLCFYKSSTYGNNGTLKTIYLPKFSGLIAATNLYRLTALTDVTFGRPSILGNQFNYSTLLVNVTFDWTAQTIKDTSSFPWGARTACVFHGNDNKDVVYQGAAWTVVDRT